jgi:branched-chain amino acid transport system substrate-binding protein
MRKKAILALTLSLALVFSLLAGCGPDTASTNAGTSGGAADGDMPVVRLGVFQPATGANGAGGRQETLGTEYAHYLHPTVEIGGVEHQVVLEIVDNQSSTAHGPAAAAELVARGVDIILGSYGSAVSMASSDVFLDAGLTAIGVSCTNPGVTRGNEHYFRICFLDPFQGQILASLATKSLNASTAYVLALAGDDYSMGLSNYFIEAFESLGGNVHFETFPEGTSDFSAFMTNANAVGADVIFSPTSTEAAALIIDAAHIQDVGIPLLAGDTWDSNVVLSAAEGRNVTIYITTFYQEGGSPNFDAGIKEWINASPVNLANNGGNDMVAGVTAMGYDAYMVALDILQRAGSLDQTAIRNATVATSFMGPVAGLIVFDSDGNAARDTAFVKTANTQTGEWEFYAQQGL